MTPVVAFEFLSKSSIAGGGRVYKLSRSRDTGITLRLFSAIPVLIFITMK